MIDGVALQRPDIDRLVFREVAHASALAQYFRRADPRAGAAKDILLQDRMSGTLDVAGRYLADEPRNVDAGRASFDAGGVIAEVAAARIKKRALDVHRYL